MTREVASTRPEIIRRLEAAAAERNHARSAALLVGAVVATALFLGGRERAPLIAPPALAAEAGTPSPVAGTVVVHVAGAVKRPGIYELPAGARIADAIELAGGALPRADLSALNLAEVVTDGQQVLVGARGATAAAPMAAPTTTAALVDLNTADQAALERVPGIGPVKAAAILAYRSEIGSFTDIGQLLEVTGIGAATLESLRPYVTL